MKTLNTLVCVGTSERYNDNNGAYTMFYMFDGETVTTEGGSMSGMSFNTYTVTSDLDLIVKASLIDNLVNGVKDWHLSADDAQAIKLNDDAQAIKLNNDVDSLLASLVGSYVDQMIQLGDYAMTTVKGSYDRLVAKHALIKFN